LHEPGRPSASLSRIRPTDDYRRISKPDSARLVSNFIGPVFPIALTLIYYDQRIRREGFDIEWMMNAAGMTARVTAPAAAPSIDVPESEEGPA
jgi:hypothetical protein